VRIATVAIPIGLVLTWGYFYFIYLLFIEVIILYYIS